jgi:hypothetical protein
MHGRLHAAFARVEFALERSSMSFVVSAPGEEVSVEA